MTFKSVFYLVIFCAMQAAAQIIFKWGSMSESRWWWGFGGGNLFGFSSIWLLMLIYKDIHPNTALGIASGGAFLASQFALFLVFKPKMGLLHWVGIAAIVFGMVAFLMAKTTE